MGVPILIITVASLFFLGAAVYSFLNVVIFRVPRGEEFVKTRSHCPNCGRVLTPAELIPVVSYLCLRGKCKNCGSKIGIRDVSIEIFGGLSALLTAYYFVSPVTQALYWTPSMIQKLLGYEEFMAFFYGAVLAGVTAFALIGILTVICFINIDTGKVKAGTLIALAVIGTIGVFTLLEVDFTDRLIGTLIGLVPLLILGIITKNQNLCAGSMILAVAGCVFGYHDLLIMVAVAVVVGALWAVVLLLTGTKKLAGRFRIVPVLCIAVVIGIFDVSWIFELIMLG